MASSNKTPQIRFKGFTDPWEQRKFSEAFSFLRNNTLSRAELSDSVGSICNIHYGDVLIKFGEVLDLDEEALPRIADDSLAMRLSCPELADGDLVIADTAEDEAVGKCSELRKVGKKHVVSGLHTMAARPQFEFGVGYLGYYMNAPAFHEQLLSLMQGIKVVSVSKTAIGNIDLSYPCLGEQQQIGAFFTRLDTLITLHQRKCDKLGAFKKSMLEKMFPKPGCDVPEVRFAGFTAPWEQRKLGEVVAVGSGRDYKHLEEGPIPVYGTGGYMLSVNEALSYGADAIGIGRKGTIDKPYLLHAPFWTVDTLFYVVPNANNDLRYMLGHFERIDWKSKDESTGVPSLSKDTIASVDVAMTNLEEQAQIGAFFTRLDTLITLHQRKLEMLKRLKKSCLQKMFV